MVTAGLVILGAATASNVALAQDGCASYRQITHSPSPEGALASLRHLIEVLEAAIAAMDSKCDFAIENLSPSQQIEQRQAFVDRLRQTREACSQIASGSSC
ncbi:hypothetical protein [Novosphingobium sp.]|uniref:hypothetical protein n=1 Tax=Novosphingobium sp. TaxID=1874826 RepID=UPI002FDC81CF